MATYWRGLAPLWAVFISLPVMAQAQSTIPAPGTAPAQHMMTQGYYVREPTDRAWNIKITGEVPSLPGMYVIVHDTAGKLLAARNIPHGTYPPDKPLILPFPPDGSSGDYKIYFVAQQDDYLGLNLPLSDLPYEVYSGGFSSLGQSKELIAFKVSKDITRLGLRAYLGFLQIFDSDKKLIADSRAGISLMVPGEQNKDFYNTKDHPIEFPVDAERVYWLRADTMYFQPRDPTFFAFDPQRLFEPDIAKLDAVKWWELVK